MITNFTFLQINMIKWTIMKILWQNKVFRIIGVDTVANQIWQKLAKLAKIWIFLGLLTPRGDHA